MENAPLLCRNPALCKVVLEMLDAAKSKDGLPFGSRSAERLWWFVRRVNVWVKRGLSPSLLHVQRRWLILCDTHRSSVIRHRGPSGNSEL
jgi:hypothetical protein